MLFRRQTTDPLVVEDFSTVSRATARLHDWLAERFRKTHMSPQAPVEVVIPTHSRRPVGGDEVDILRAVLHDEIRRGIHQTMMRRTRYWTIAISAVVVVGTVFAVGLAWSRVDVLQAGYAAARGLDMKPQSAVVTAVQKVAPGAKEKFDSLKGKWDAYLERREARKAAEQAAPQK